MSSFIDALKITAKDVAVAAVAVDTTPIKVGPSGPLNTRARLRVNLSTGFSAGNLSTIAFKTSAAEDKSNPKTLLTITLNDTAQTMAKKLVEFELPEECLDWVWLTLTPTGTGAGAKVWAGIVTENDLRL